MILAKKTRRSESTKLFLDLLNGVLGLSEREKQVLSVVLENKDYNVQDLSSVALSNYGITSGTFNTYYYRLKSRGMLDNRLLLDLYDHYTNTGIVAFQITVIEDEVD